jgi:hypothetical protein
MNKLIKILKTVAKVLTVIQVIRGKKSAKHMVKHQGKKSAFKLIKKLLK